MASLDAVLRWPWLPPGLAVVAVGMAGELGRGWLFVTLGVVVVGALSVVSGLYAWGRRSVMPSVRWPDQVVAQLERYWEEELMPVLAGLEDDEYLPVPTEDCLTVRLRRDSWFAMDPIDPAAAPPADTTIAWHLAYLGIEVLGKPGIRHFGDAAATLRPPRWPARPAAAVAELNRHYRRWLTGLRDLTEVQFAAPVDDGEFAGQPFIAMVLHVNSEVIRHGEQIVRLRERYSRGLASPSGQ